MELELIGGDSVDVSEPRLEIGRTNDVVLYALALVDVLL